MSFGSFNYLPAVAVAQIVVVVVIVVVVAVVAAPVDFLLDAVSK